MPYCESLQLIIINNIQAGLETSLGKRDGNLPWNINVFSVMADAIINPRLCQVFLIYSKKKLVDLTTVIGENSTKLFDEIYLHS